MATQRSATLSIGQLAKRTGLAVSAIRFYDTIGLVKPKRNAGDQRRFQRSDIRRLSFVLIARKLGFTLEEIREQLDALPDQRTPTQRDWQRMSRQFKQNIDQRIETLERLRARLSGCIGCGCLSLKCCSLYNPDDRAASLGTGPRYLLGNDASDIPG